MKLEKNKEINIFYIKSFTTVKFIIKFLGSAKKYPFFKHFFKKVLLCFILFSLITFIIKNLPHFI